MEWGWGRYSWRVIAWFGYLSPLEIYLLVNDTTVGYSEIGQQSPAVEADLDLIYVIKLDWPENLIYFGLGIPSIPLRRELDIWRSDFPIGIWRGRRSYLFVICPQIKMLPGKAVRVTPTWWSTAACQLIWKAVVKSIESDATSKWQPLPNPVWWP